jgi:hypothetical protein
MYGLSILQPCEGKEANDERLTDMLFQGEGEAFNVGAFLESISPYAWATTGIGLCIGLSVVGAAWSVQATGRARWTMNRILRRDCDLGESSSPAHRFWEVVLKLHESGQRI